MKIGVMLGEKQNEIDDIEDKLEDTFLIASSNKRMDSSSEEIGQNQKGSCVFGERNR